MKIEIKTINELRKVKGITQKDIAKVVTPAVYRKILKKDYKYQPHETTIKKLAILFWITVKQFNELNK